MKELKSQVQSVLNQFTNGLLLENTKALLNVFGYESDRTKFRHQVLNPLIVAGLLEMTIPDKPTSSKQRYRLTDKGKKYLRKLPEK